MSEYIKPIKVKVLKVPYYSAVHLKGQIGVINKHVKIQGKEQAEVRMTDGTLLILPFLSLEYIAY